MRDPPHPGVGSDRTLESALGFEIIETGREIARGRFEITDSVRQIMGLVHGGAYAALAETLASAATHASVSPDGKIALGHSNHTSFLRPAAEGFVHGEARSRHRGRTSWIWDVELKDDDGRLCAIARVTLAVRPAPPAQG